MTDPSGAEVDPRKVRLGLALIVTVVAVAIVASFLIDDAVGKALMFAVAGIAFVRALLLVRWLRGERTTDR